MERRKPIIFSSLRYEYLRDRVLARGDFRRGEVERKSFPDGECYQRIACDVSFQDVVLIGGTVSDSDTLEIFDLSCALVKYGAESLTLVVPYLGYSTMDRAVKYGEVVTAKTRARLLSSIPIAQHGNRIVLMDLHSPGLNYYFEGGITPVCASAHEVIKKICLELASGDFVLACTDAGRAKWVQSLADEMKVDASFVFKRRLDGERTELAAVSAHVEGRRVIIYDDMIRTGSSLITAARAYKAAGAGSIAAVATHGVLPGDALERLQETGLFSEIVCTDTHPRARELEGDRLRVQSVGELIAQLIGNATYAVGPVLD